MEKISLKADYTFKELFAHEKVRKQFLSDVLLVLNDDRPDCRTEWEDGIRGRGGKTDGTDKDDQMVL